MDKAEEAGFEDMKLAEVEGAGACVDDGALLARSGVAHFHAQRLH